jgi:hypothetical protein
LKSIFLGEYYHKFFYENTQLSQSCLPDTA